MNPSKLTTSKIRALKGKARFACLTAADYFTARLIDEAGLPMILVGDSLAMTVLGHKSTLPATMEAMLHHTSAVVRGAGNAMVVGDMPFLSYQISVPEAIRNAGRFIQQAGADAVKIEGGVVRAATARALVESGIPVLGHIGLTPQSVLAMGGYKIQGRRPEQVEQLLRDAAALEDAGVFAIVLECVPPDAGREITAAVGIPTIGIGAGPHCDGQILVTHDLLGMIEGEGAKFVKHYAELGAQMRKAFSAYKEDVERGGFPGSEHCYK